ncbi:MAG: thioredoxin domain-containing protein [Candidatus Eremiobacteraeota bacterium]|nr:thioredoxin domain-containing protein [Candidatus Eremiobacteraeota bacterium]MCW5865918.1 thioredoxin domain-containing protein [Candidatus Eremiobacteraeota bacterium]
MNPGKVSARESLLACVFTSTVTTAVLSILFFPPFFQAYLENDRHASQIQNALDRSMAAAQKRSERRDVDYQLAHRTPLNLEGCPSTGMRSAPITVTYFLDYECRNCVKTSEQLTKLCARWPDKVRIVFKAFPVSYHPHAVDSAVAALAAERQGAFLAMKDYLFQHQEELDFKLYLQAAKHLKLDEETFKKDLKDPILLARVRQDKEEATRLGITGAPTVYINGILVSAYRYIHYQDVVQILLERREGEPVSPDLRPQPSESETPCC